MKKILNFFASSRFILIFSLIINIAIFVLISYFLNSVFYGIAAFVVLLFASIFLIKSKSQPLYKLMWGLFIFVAPVFGCVLYLRANCSHGTRKKRKDWQNMAFLSSSYLPSNTEQFSNLKKSNMTAFKQSQYIANTINMPIYENCTTKYLHDGETYFKEMFDMIKKAKKYIFMEYFIFKEGRIWDELFNLLKEKAREGVEIKILYDDMGCLDKFSDKNTFKKLSNYNIEALPFNKVSGRYNSFINFRDHRKIIVVDGIHALTGGINIADEYANIIDKYGTWKDCGIKISGDAVWSMVVMFINSWHFSTSVRLEYEKYKSDEKIKGKESIQPYGTSPLTYEPVARNIYLNLINSAQKNIYITTPYLILDEEMVTALKLATKSGVEVNIVFPKNPDKKSAFYLARGRFADLIKAGIKIYEFDGFVHAKTVMIDDHIASIGTVNMDFRSLYLHFENGVMLYDSPTLSDIKKDATQVLGSSHLITLKDMKKRKFTEKFCSAMLRFVSPFF